MRRCKLISPTNLMLEHPILSPVEECEYILLGMKESKKVWHKMYFTGLVAGIGVGVSLACLIMILRFPCILK